MYVIKEKDLRMVLILLLLFLHSAPVFSSASNINYSVFFKLEHFLRAFLKSRSHTFKSSHQFLEVAQKVFFFFYIFDQGGGLIGSAKIKFKQIKFGMMVKWPIF